LHGGVAVSRFGARLLGVWLLVLGTGAARADEASLILEIESPLDRAEVPGLEAFVAGRALAPHGDARGYDVVVAIDSSASTSEPAGLDADGDGRIESPSPLFRLQLLAHLADDDSVLAGEVAAAQRLLARLDPRTTRMGVVSFRGDQDASSSDARVWLVPEHDHGRVHSILEKVRAAGSKGMTNMAAGVAAAVDALQLARRRPHALRAPAESHVLFLTDGRPTAPHSYLRNVRDALEVAHEARRAGIRVHTFALGAEAKRAPLVAVELARITGGRFTAVRNLSQLALELERIELSRIERLSVVNQTLERAATELRHEPDGSFAALLELRPGLNELCASARSVDGRSARRCVRVRVTPHAVTPRLEARHCAQRGRLLDQRLRQLRQRRVALEVQRDALVRRSLAVELEVGRVRTRSRSVQIGIDRDQRARPAAHAARPGLF
jgi:hypothetical protein